MTNVEIVEEQLAAYNTRDIDRFCRMFAEDVVAYSLKDNTILFEGIAGFRKTYGDLFAASPALHAKIVKRMQVGEFVIDEERIHDLRGQEVHAVAIYKIAAGRIANVWFAR